MVYRRPISTLKIGWRLFCRQIAKLLRNPVFFVITLLGNGILLFASTVFYLVESGRNPAVHNFFDALWWGCITMTTVGYGDVTPHTWAGRVVAVVLIFTGGVMFLSFIALLASALVSAEVHELEERVVSLEHELHHEK